jgi:hypothetical protein
MMNIMIIMIQIIQNAKSLKFSRHRNFFLIKF